MADRSRALFQLDADQAERMAIEAEGTGSTIPGEPTGNRPRIEPGPLQSGRRLVPALISVRDLVDVHRARLASITSGSEAPVPTGFPQLDEQLDGGLWPGLTMLVGSTGSSKTQLAMQTALHAAQQGIPVAYVLFEMDAADGMHRLMGELADVQWSGLQRGHATVDELARVEARYGQLPSCLCLEAAEPYRWPSERVFDVAAGLRALSPTGPALTIIDYTQLSGDISEDTRQRVMRVALDLQTAAKRHRIAALAVSSTGRPGYAILADIVARAGIGDEPTPSGRRRTVNKAHEVIGLGKECGELEYSADYVTVLGSGGESESAGRLIIAATVKRRTGPPSWCALRQDNGRLRSAPDIEGADDLPTAHAADNLDERVLAAVAGGTFTSEAQLRVELGCSMPKLQSSLRRLRANGRIAKDGQRGHFRAVLAAGGT
jgi:hypothetical protein